MKVNDITLSKSLVGAMLAMWTIVVLMVCNIDSYLYAQCGQFDSAVFFMCGKAMMNRLVPYSDFTDSKGVLLWFIYGLGYLWDHSFTNVENGTYWHYPVESEQYNGIASKVSSQWRTATGNSYDDSYKTQGFSVRCVMDSGA